MNGRTLALGLTAGLAVASVLSKRQGARNGWDRDEYLTECVGQLSAAQMIRLNRALSAALALSE